jgi:acyl carrier protein
MFRVGRRRMFVNDFDRGAMSVRQRTQIRQTLQHILEDETDSQLAELPDAMVLTEAFDLDSVDRVSLMMRVEEHFHIRMTNDELSGISTIGSLVDLVQAKVVELPASQTARRAA